MSALAGARSAFVELVQGAAPGVQVSPFPLGEDQRLSESVIVGRVESRFDWRCIGPRRTNRSENVALTATVSVYRHAGRQQVAAMEALARVDELLETIEYAVADSLDLNNSVTHARVSEWSVESEARNDGWVAVGTLRVEADNFPTS